MNHWSVSSPTTSTPLKTSSKLKYTGASNSNFCSISKSPDIPRERELIHERDEGGGAGRRRKSEDFQIFVSRACADSNRKYIIYPI